MTHRTTAVSRRRFIGLVALVGAGLGSGCKEAPKHHKQVDNDTDPIVSILRRKLGDLELDDDGMRAFATEWLERTKGKLAFLSRNEEMVASFYLLSSDFFLHQADESRVIQYVSLYDPRLGCRNPFARFDA